VVLAEALGVGAGDGDGVAFGVDGCVEHGGGDGAGGRDETLDLARPPVFCTEPTGEATHVGKRGAGKRADEIGDDELLFAVLAGTALEDGEELLEDAEGGLAHELEDVVAVVLGGELELASDEFADEGLDVVGVAKSEVVADA
jgi:hypothetical protein